MKPEENYDVAIIGLGPVGATLANLLGKFGVKTLALEREVAHFPLPRAVHFDDEIMRVFQWIGVAEPMIPKMRLNPGMRFVDANGKLLLDWPRPMEESALGWNPSWRFHQPDLEAELRKQLTVHPSVRVLTGCEATSIEDTKDGVSVRFRNHGEEEISSIRTKYVVGCDGARSLVRQQIGHEMEDYGFHERWLVVDVLLKVERPDLGDHSVQYCDPKRPCTYVRGPDCRRRWEITLHDDEDTQRMSNSAEVWKLLEKWVCPEEAELVRAAVYTFHSLNANSWRKGRLLIAGDAAHQTPPFMGQGMCAGIRDVANLSWKLAEVINNRAGDELLDSYQSERFLNAEAFIKTAVRLGGLINAADSEAALRAGMPKKDGAKEMKSIYPPLGPGLGVGHKLGPNVGRMFGQPRLPDGSRLDDRECLNHLVIADREIAGDLNLPEGLALLTTKEVPDAMKHLSAFDAKAVLLRPDRYIFGSGNNASEMNEVLSKFRSLLQ